MQKKTVQTASYKFCQGHSISNELKKWKSQPTISDFPQI